MLWAPFEFSVSFELILRVSFEFSVSFEVILGIQGPVSELKHIYCQNRLAACQAAYWKILHCYCYIRSVNNKNKNASFSFEIIVFSERTQQKKIIIT